MSGRKMPKSLKTWLIPKLRRLSMYWPGKTIARDNAKVYIEEGTYLNGKPKIVRYYVCANCGVLGNEKTTQMDHISPVIETTGFTNWDEYMNSLYCNPSNYACLCLDCHSKKTINENRERNKNKA